MQVVEDMYKVGNSNKAIAKAKKNISRIDSITYKNFFVIPKVKVEWKQGELSGGKGRIYGGLYFSINGKPVRGWTMFDWASLFKTKTQTQQYLDTWLSQLLTRTINAIEPNASRDKLKAKSIVEKTYGIEVKEVRR